MSVPTQAECRNALLRRPSPDDFDDLTTPAHLVDLQRGEVLCDPGEDKCDVFLPETGMASVTFKVAPMKIEIGCIGREGFVGIPLLLGAESGPSSVFVQQPGTFVRVPADAFLMSVEASRDLSNFLHRYVHA